jgi:RHS repeat-associated protein
MGKTVSIYYFHPDHLGTETFVSDANGEPYQFFLNLPFGELRSNREHHIKINYECEQTMAEQRAGSWQNPFKFNGKELDQETGLYYYGARYYNPRWSSWLSVDPHAENYPSLSPYTYVANNPINAIDPDGRDIWELNSSGKVINRIENTEIDQFVIIDNDGNRIEGNTYEYGTVTQRKGHEDTQKRDITFFEVSGDQNATEIFEFLGDNFSKECGMPIEWTHAKVGKDNSGRNIIGTIHKPNKTSVGHYLRQKGYTLREVNHNHPMGTDPSGPSQFNEGDLIYGDVLGAKYYQDKFSKVELNVYRTKFGNYDKSGYHPYDRNGYIPSSKPNWRNYKR